MAYQSVVSGDEIRLTSTQPLDEVLSVCWPDTKDYRRVVFTTAAPVDLGECIVTLMRRYQRFQSIHPEYTLRRRDAFVQLTCGDIHIERAFEILQQFHEVSQVNPGLCRYQYIYDTPGLGEIDNDIQVSQGMYIAVVDRNIVDRLVECMRGMTMKFRVHGAGRFIHLSNVSEQSEDDLKVKIVNGIAEISMEITRVNIDFVRAIPYPKQIRYVDTIQPAWGEFVTIPNITRFITSTFPSDYTGIPVFIELEDAENTWTYPKFAGVYLDHPQIQDGVLSLGFNTYRRVDKLLARVNPKVCNDTPYRDVIVILLGNSNITAYPLATFWCGGVTFNYRTPIENVPRAYQDAMRQIHAHLVMQGEGVDDVLDKSIPNKQINEAGKRMRAFLGVPFPNV